MTTAVLDPQTTSTCCAAAIISATSDGYHLAMPDGTSQDAPRVTPLVAAAREAGFEPLVAGPDGLVTVASIEATLPRTADELIARIKAHRGL